jgi:adenosylhomocysteine nucleosidase
MIRRVASIVLVLSALTSAGESQEPLIAILGAIGPEVQPLTEQFKEVDLRKIEGMEFAVGRLKGHRVVVGLTGVGAVNAAAATTLLIEHFHPAAVIFTGIAGGLNPDLRPGDVVIAEKTVHHDVGTLTPQGLVRRGTRSLLTGDRNPVFFPADPDLLKAALAAKERVKLQPIQTYDGERTPRIVAGIVATGGVFVAQPAKRDELRKDLRADAVEMEGAAVAQICRQWRVPCLVIRCVSDQADGQAREDAMVFAEAASANAAILVTEIVDRIAASRKAGP